MRHRSRSKENLEAQAQSPTHLIVGVQCACTTGFWRPVGSTVVCPDPDSAWRSLGVGTLLKSSAHGIHGCLLLLDFPRSLVESSHGGGLLIPEWRRRGGEGKVLIRWLLRADLFGGRPDPKSAWGLREREPSSIPPHAIRGCLLSDFPHLTSILRRRRQQGTWEKGEERGIESLRVELGFVGWGLGPELGTAGWFREVDGPFCKIGRNKCQQARKPPMLGMLWCLQSRETFNNSWLCNSSVKPPAKTRDKFPIAWTSASTPVATLICLSPLWRVLPALNPYCNMNSCT